MALKVVFAFDEGAGGVTNFFQLDETPQGVLDNPTYTLGGAFSLVDVTEYVRQVSISRGRSRLLDRVQSGAATVVLDNRARLFDPTAGTAVSPYSTSIVPRKNVSVMMDDEPIFSGLVDDWNIDFELSGDSTTTAICADGFAILGQVAMGTAARSSELSGTRIDTVLDEAAWPTVKRSLDVGEVTLQADTPAANTNVLDYLNTVTDTEFGVFFMNRQGEAAFIDRDGSQDFSNPVLLGGTGIPLSSISVDYGSEQLFNDISLVRNGGGTATATDATSKTAYGINELSKTGLLFNTDDDNQELADFLLAKFKDPKLRIQQVTIAVDGLSAAQRLVVAGLDIVDPVQVSLSPPVGPTITQYATIDRIDHSISPASHVMTLSMSEASASFLLDSLLFGLLDENTLGF